MTLTDYAAPLHPLAIADIALRRFERPLSFLPHWEERPVHGLDRLRARIHAVIDYAMAHGLAHGRLIRRAGKACSSIVAPRPKLCAGHMRAIAYARRSKAWTGLQRSTGTERRARSKFVHR